MCVKYVGKLHISDISISNFGTRVGHITGLDSHDICSICRVKLFQRPYLVLENLSTANCAELGVIE